MGILSNILAVIKDYLNQKNINKANDVNKIVSVVQVIQQQGQTPSVGPYIEHPLHKLRLQQYSHDIVDFRKTSSPKQRETIAFGDSVLDIPKGQYTSIEPVLNFAISGSWANHMEQMAIDTQPLLMANYYGISNVVVGTLGGNQFLAFQEFNSIVTTSISCLNAIRKLFPMARIIVYGLPPVYNTWATQNALPFEGKICEWIVNDYNSCFIPMYGKFGSGLLNMMPNTDNSKDGVHLTDKGVLMLDNLIQKGKSAKPKSIIS